MNHSATLPRFSLPLAAGGTYRAFEIGDDYMLPVAPGTSIVARYVDDWHSLTPSAPHIVVSQKEGIQFRRVSWDADSLVLACDNPLYSTTHLPLTSVLELWEAKAYISGVTLESVASLTRDLMQQVKALKGNRI
jgi:hypothetical protein